MFFTFTLLLFDYCSLYFIKYIQFYLLVCRVLMKYIFEITSLLSYSHTHLPAEIKGIYIIPQEFVNE